MKELKRWLKTGLVAIVLMVLSVSLSAAWWGGDRDKLRESRMPQGNPISNPQLLLEYALPIDNPSVRKLQGYIEDIATQLRANRRWNAIQSDIKSARFLINYKEEELLASVPEERQAKAKDILADIGQNLDTLDEIVEAQDKSGTWSQRAAIIDRIGALENLMVAGFPYEVPQEYANLPQLKGRATVEMETERGSLKMVVDGYNAPVTAGNFVDLIQRGVYDDIKFTRAEESYVLQTGDPKGPEDGFVDPETGEERTIPLEIRVRSENEPVYGFTLDEVGLYREEPVLPFSAYGTLAMAHPDYDVNGGSSQFFFFLFEPELTPAGLNLLDGRYAVFGYVVEGKEVLRNITKGDRIISTKVVEGLENLVAPAAA
ncbi:MAG: peptidylprolyl isomerase [Cyanobacteriota bacterium]|nr:peptidylprolyl isomerase [Cyanobacteriota bacterium]